MLSAEMLSWILGARRFSSIARICDWRTPVTVTSCNSSAAAAASSVPAPPVPDLAFLASGGGVVAASCGAGLWGPAFCAGAPVCSDAMAALVAAPSNAMDIATDRGCLRWCFDTAYPSRLLFSRSQMPDAALFALSISKCHSLQQPVAIAWIASGKKAQIACVFQRHAPSTFAAEKWRRRRPRHVDPMTDCATHLCPLLCLLIRSIDESISHAVRFSSSISGFTG